MTLSEELAWRGLTNQMTYKDPGVIDGAPITFYWGVDPSADSMTVGNLAIAMLVRHFVNHGHKAVLLVGGATGLIGDPDGKSEERQLQSAETIARNKAKIIEQYEAVFAGQDFRLVDNYDWFKGIDYLSFLRDIGKHVPLRQMLGRDFVQSRLGEGAAGISYAEFSYALIQAYDFLHLHREYGVDLQVCGADQWGNSIAGVDLIRRLTGHETHVWSAPLVVNKATGIKFGKSETGAIWLDPAKTTPTQFYQFWINVEDANVEDYLKIYTLLAQEEIEQLVARQKNDPGAREAQRALARVVTGLVHGESEQQMAEQVTGYLTGAAPIGEAAAVLEVIRQEIPSVKTAANGSVVEALVSSGLAVSNTEARRFLSGSAVSVNGQRISREQFEAADFQNGRLLMRRGKAFKDSVLVELA